LANWIPWLLGGFAFFTPFSIAGAHLCLGAATLLLLIDRESRSFAVRLGRTHFLAAPVYLWIAASILCVIFAEDPGRSAEKLKKLALLVLLPLAALPQSRRAVRPILGALLISTAIISAIGVTIHLLQGGGLAARNRGAGGFYMTVAGIAMMVALLSLAEILAALKDPRPRRLVFLGVAFALSLAALLATYTRSSWIGFAVGTLILVRRHRTALLAFAVGAVLFAIWGPPEARDRLTSIVHPDDPHNVERVLIWERGLELLKRDPFTGTGLWIPPEDMSGGEMSTPQGVMRVHSHMHSTPLQVAVTMGIPGLVAFGILIVAFFRLAKRARSAELRNLWEEGLVAAYPAILVALLVNGLFEWNFGDSEVLGLFEFLTGAVLGIEAAKRTTTKPEGR
jgi:O-antigen ligase